jgi:hypothetical protein
MNWLQRLFGMDKPRAAGSVDGPIDPATVVHIATLPLWQTPLIVKGLEQRNIVATFAEMSSELTVREPTTRRRRVGR